MRVALKIAYLGDAFYGHQRQPDLRTVEGECLRALKAARILPDPATAFFRSASRTDRGVSAIGNVIAFDASLPPRAVVGAFNDRATGVWAWAVAAVSGEFHPRHARERWYRYHVADPPPVERLRAAGAAFVGAHDFGSFTSDRSAGALSVTSVDVRSRDGFAIIDVRAPRFRRGMVRRIVSAMLEHARGKVALDQIVATLAGDRRDFGTVPAEPLFLMDVLYDFPFRIILGPKVRDEWSRLGREAALRTVLVRDWFRAARDRESL